MEIPSENHDGFLSVYGLVVSSSPEKGRCLTAAKEFSPGQVIISQEPYVSVPNNSSGASKCEVCFTSENVKKCSACHVVWYCGSTCQKMDWKLHRFECQTLSKLEKKKLKYITPSIRLIVKLYLKRKSQNEKVVPTSEIDNFNLVEALVSHISEVDEKQLVVYAQMANLVNLILQWPDLNLKEVAEMFSKLACNAHSICDSELRPLGTGLYPIISIINHSCLPNSILVFEGRRAIVRAVEYIPKGTEVLISYIETAGSTTTRQKALKEQYFFRCSCPRCINFGQPEDVKESAIMEGYRCINNRCDGFLLRDLDNIGFKCQKCGRVRKIDDIKEIATEVKTLIAKADNSLASFNYHEAISMYKRVEELQLKLHHPLSLSLMHTRESLMKIFMEVNNWKEALAYCRLTIPVYENVYPGLHPMRGLQYYACGKLEWLLGETESCVGSLTKALDILRVTHGLNTSFVKELILKLEEAHAEVSYGRRHVLED